jgi:hypothetical protein
MTTTGLLKKIDQIPPAYLAEVEDFVDFILQKKNDVPVKPGARKLGLLKGKLHMSPDFDEPLEEFKDYM